MMGLHRCSVEQILLTSYQMALVGNPNLPAFSYLLGVSSGASLAAYLDEFAHERVEVDLSFEWPEAFYSVEFFCAFFSRVVGSRHFGMLREYIDMSDLYVCPERGGLAVEALRRIDATSAA